MKTVDELLNILSLRPEYFGEEGEAGPFVYNNGEYIQEKLEKFVGICYTIYNLIKPSSSVSSQRSGLFLCTMCIFFML